MIYFLFHRESLPIDSISLIFHKERCTPLNLHLSVTHYFRLYSLLNYGTDIIIYI